MDLNECRSLMSGAQVAQTLMGPKAFSLDRLIAIFGSLLMEHDRPKHADVLGTRAALEWEKQVNETMASAGVHQLVRPLSSLSCRFLGLTGLSLQVAHLASLHLVQRIGPADRLNGTTFKTGIGWETAVLLGEGLGFRLNEFWAGDV